MKMIKVKNKTFIIICTFLFAVILCGAASATTTFSTTGKTISVTYKFVPSTLKTSENTVTKKGTYGYGTYSTIKVTGKDNKGRYKNSTTIVYNNIIRSMTLITRNNKGFYVKEKVKLVSNNYISVISGKIDSKTTFKGKKVYPIYYLKGQQLFKTGTGTINFYKNGKFYSQFKSTEKTIYKNINGYYEDVKDVDTSSTVYANGNTRKSVITHVYLRNSIGEEIGMKISGTSNGTEKINNKLIKYTGKIYIGTKYDPKDIMNSEYNEGNYKEVRTSSSSVLLKIIPYESINTN